jgi:heme exporter protein D
MLAQIQSFFYMHGYGTYVFSAYSIVLITLAGMGYLAWRPWRQYLRQQKINSHE